MFLLNLKGIASKSSKPSSFNLSTNRQIAWFLPAEGSLGSLKSTVQELFDLRARLLHCVLKSLRVTSTHRFTSASLASKAICPSSAAKDIAVAWQEDLWAQRCLKVPPTLTGELFNIAETWTLLINAVAGGLFCDVGSVTSWVFKSDIVPCKKLLMHVCLARFWPCNLRRSLLLPCENASLNRHLANLSSQVDGWEHWAFACEMLKGSHTYQSCHHHKIDPYQTCETWGKGYKPATTKTQLSLETSKFFMAHDQSHTWRWKACNTVFICHIFSIWVRLCRKVYATHSTKRARVAPVKLVRHMGHCRSPADSWHFLHTECPHGTRATRCLFSWQMGQWPFMPCGWVASSLGKSPPSFAMLQAAFTRVTSVNSSVKQTVAEYDVKPCFPSQFFNNCKAQSRIIDGQSTSRQAVHPPFVASASQRRIKRCCVSFTHRSRHVTLAASVFWPNCCAKAMSQRKISEEQLSLDFLSFKMPASIIALLLNPLFWSQNFDIYDKNRSSTKSTWHTTI